jgi:hypothetical protein
MWSDFILALKELDFRQLNELIVGIDMLTLLKDPYVIAFMVVCSIFFIIRGMEKALVTFLSAPAFLVLFQKTVEGTSALDFEADKLLIFVGGFVVISAVNIYVYFVRGK